MIESGILGEDEHVELLEGEIVQMSPQILVVEVADSSVRYDLNVKARIYARARIPEYGWWWSASMPSRCSAIPTRRLGPIGPASRYR